MLKSFRKNTDEPLPFANIVPLNEAIEAFKVANSSLGLTQFFSDSLTESWRLLTVSEQDVTRVFLFQPNQTIGTGAQGQIFLAQEVFSDKSNNLTQGQLVVVKKMCDQTLFQNEKKILKHLGRFYGAYKNDHDLYLISEYAPGKTLLDTLYHKDGSQFIKKEHDLIFSQKIIHACLKELNWLHQEMGVLHRDIKPDNIIIYDNRGRVTARFIDFDSACLIQQSNRTFCGTHGYQSPESYLPTKQRPVYSLQSEYYSLGVVFCEILSKQKAEGPHNYQEFISSKLHTWQGANHLGTFNQSDLMSAFPEIFNPKLAPENKYERMLCSMIQKLSHENPHERSVWDDIPKMIRVVLRKNLDDYMRTQSLIFASRSDITRLRSESSEKPERPSSQQPLLFRQFSQLSLVGRDIKHPKEKSLQSKVVIPRLALDQLPAPTFPNSDFISPVHSPSSHAARSTAESSSSSSTSLSKQSTDKSVSKKSQRKSQISSAPDKKKF